MVSRPSAKAYVPDRGDIVWLNFSPNAGHEQGGLRPALTISPKVYNAKTGLGLFCPMTSKVKGYPFEVSLPTANKITGVVLCDQIRNCDWRARQATFIEKLSPGACREVLAKLGYLVQ